MEHKKVLGVGHPRTGTQYHARLLSSFGVRVSHERMGQDGVVGWMLCAQADRYPYLGKKWDSSNVTYDYVIYNVRDPRDSIPSIVHTEDTKPNSVKFRKQHSKFDQTQNPVENAMRSLIAWDALIETLKPDFRWRIEDQAEELFRWLKSEGFDVEWSTKVVGQKKNTRDHPGWSEELETALQTVDPRVINQMNSVCARWGYQTRF